MPMSALNQLRRDFFEAYVEYLLPAPVQINFQAPTVEITPVPTAGTAVIATQDKKADIFIYKPQNYAAISEEDLKNIQAKKFLYLPPFFTGADIALVQEKLPLFEGIYCDGYYGLALARELNMDFFAGTGWNLTNRFSVSEAKRYAKYFALSKELSATEQRHLSAEGAYVLSGGAIKIMDLCYCPFGGKCTTCDKRECYTLTDESGRKFPLRRFRGAGKLCRFELYNCNPLAENTVQAGKLTDETVALSTPATKGHMERSML